MKFLLCSAFAVALSQLGNSQCILDRVANPAGEGFGYRPSLSGDWLGMTARNPTGVLLHLFHQQTSGAWEHAQTLAFPAPAFTPVNVALDGDRMIVSVGNRLEPYQLQTGSWVSSGPAKLVQPTITHLAYDHPWVAISNPYYDISFIYLNGLVQVFALQPDGTLTSQFGASGFPLDQLYGASLDLDGDRLVFGAPGYDSFGKADTGHVFTVELPSNATTKLYDPFPGPQPDDFGDSIAVSGDLLAVGNSKGSGKVQTFRRQAGTWLPETTLLPPAGMAHFGTALEMDGINLLVSAQTAQFGGQVRFLLYQRLQGQWFLRTSFDEPEGAALVESGAIDGQRVVTGSETYGTPGQLAGSLWIWDRTGSNCPGQITQPHTLSLAAGGSIDLVTSFAPLAAQEIYLVLGSLTGTTPGVTLGNVTVPLLFDAWSQLTLSQPNLAPFETTLGSLDALGGALSRLSVPPGTAPALAGQSVYHATLAFDPLTLDLVRSSQASAVDLLP